VRGVGGGCLTWRRRESWELQKGEARPTGGALGRGDVISCKKGVNDQDLRKIRAKAKEIAERRTLTEMSPGRRHLACGKTAKVKEGCLIDTIRRGRGMGGAGTVLRA